MASSNTDRHQELTTPPQSFDIVRNDVESPATVNTPHADQATRQPAGQADASHPVSIQAPCSPAPTNANIDDDFVIVDRHRVSSLEVLQRVNPEVDINKEDVEQMELSNKLHSLLSCAEHNDKEGETEKLHRGNDEQGLQSCDDEPIQLGTQGQTLQDAPTTPRKKKLVRPANTQPSGPLPQILDSKIPDKDVLESLASMDSQEGSLNESRSYSETVYRSVEGLGVIPEEAHSSDEEKGRSPHINRNKKFYNGPHNRILPISRFAEIDPKLRLSDKPITGTHCDGTAKYKYLMDMKLKVAREEAALNALKTPDPAKEQEFMEMKSPVPIVTLADLIASSPSKIPKANNLQRKKSGISRSPRVVEGLNVMAGVTSLPAPENGQPESPQREIVRKEVARMSSPEAVSAFSRNYTSPEPASPVVPRLLESLVRSKKPVKFGSVDEATLSTSEKSTLPVASCGGIFDLYASESDSPAPSPALRPAQGMPVAPMKLQLAVGIDMTPDMHKPLPATPPQRKRDEYKGYMPRDLPQTPQERSGIRAISDYYHRKIDSMQRKVSDFFKSDAARAEADAIRRRERADLALAAARAVDELQRQREAANAPQSPLGHQRKTSGETVEAAQGKIGVRKKSLGSIREPFLVNGA